MSRLRRFSRTASAPRAASFFVALLLAASSALAESWYESYEKAEDALRQERWSEAVRHLNAALQQRPDSAANARTYGMRFVDYFPYLKLGIAYFELGQADAALQAFETEERQQEIGKSADGRSLLADYRGRIESRRSAEAAESAGRAQGVVATSLAAARALEQQGRVEDALAALAGALAVSPDHPEANETRRRLLSQAAELGRRQGDAERRDRAVRDGRTALAAGQYGQAAARFSEALELEHDDEVDGLLEQAQARLREEISRGLDLAGRQRLVAAGIAQARRLEASGELAAALAELQSVLALDRENVAARALEQRILRAQAATDESAARVAVIDELLVEADRRLAAGEHELALRSANRVLVLEPTNDRALRQISRAYSQLSDALLTTDQNPPAIVIDDAADGAESTSELVVRSPDLDLRGTAYDATPVEMQVLRDGVPQGQVALSGREVQGLWITDFRWRQRIASGTIELDVVATDRAGNGTRVRCRVRYVVPFVRSPWFPAAIVLALAAIAAAFAWVRQRRRQKLVRDRFNPYVAGAPILEQARFFGRQQLREYVLRRVSNNSVMLYGERRIGKTSFQHELKRSLTNLADPVHDYFPVFIDLQGTPQEKFFGTLAAEIFHELTPKLGGIQPSAPPRDPSYGYPEFVEDIQRVLKALRERSTKKVKLVLLIDEVDELNDYDPRINQRLRSLFMRAFADNLVSVVSGVSIKKHWEREGSPWYNFFQEIEMKALDPAEARSLIEAPVRGIFAFDDGVADEIIRRTGGKPYLIQRLCSGLVDRMHAEKRRRITRVDVETACQVEGL